MDTKIMQPQKRYTTILKALHPMRSYKPLIIIIIIEGLSLLQSIPPTTADKPLACKELPPTMLRLSMMSNNLTLTTGIVRPNR